MQIFEKFLLQKKRIFSLLWHLRGFNKIFFYQSSPVHPVSKSRGGGVAWAWCVVSNIRFPVKSSSTPPNSAHLITIYLVTHWLAYWKTKICVREKTTISKCMIMLEVFLYMVQSSQPSLPVSLMDGRKGGQDWDLSHVLFFLFKKSAKSDIY